MPQVSLRRLLPALALSAGLALAAPPAEARRPAPAPKAGKVTPMAPSFWIWALLTRIWEENGCMIDPHGQCQAGEAPTPNPLLNGCEIDPSGRCLDQR